MGYTTYVSRLAVATALVVGGSYGAVVRAQGETFTATASAKTKAGAQVTAPVTIVVTRPTSDTERDTVVAALKSGGTAGAVKSLKAMADAGYIEVGKKKTPLKYAYARPTSGGRLLTVVTAAPIAHLGAGLPDSQPKQGFDLAVAILELKDAGDGTGELAPAATVKVNDTGALQVQDYGAETVQLTKVQGQKAKK